MLLCYTYTHTSCAIYIGKVQDCKVLFTVDSCMLVIDMCVDSDNYSARSLRVNQCMYQCVIYHNTCSVVELVREVELFCLMC